MGKSYLLRGQVTSGEGGLTRGGSLYINCPMIKNYKQCVLICDNIFIDTPQH